MAARACDIPRVRVAALMLLEGRIVLARHRAGDVCYHLLPGGGVGYRETIEEALVREVREETGLDASIVRPLYISDTIDPNGRRHLVNLTFLARIDGGHLTAEPADTRVEAVDLMSPEALYDIDLRPPLAHYINESLSAGLESCETRYLGPLFKDVPNP